MLKPLNRSIVNAVLAMASVASSGLLMLVIAIIVSIKLTSAEQGFFFTFLSFATLIQLADFGLSYATLQTASHFIGTSRASELPALASFVFRWNIVFTMVATAVVFSMGYGVFSFSAVASANDIEWDLPWKWLMLSVFVNQLAAPGIALCEGSGKIKQVWRLRLIQEWVAGGLCLLALISGLALASLALMWGGRALVAIIWLLFVERLSYGTRGKTYTLRQWMDEVWPFQWKIGLSYLAGYLIFRIFPPVILFEKGPVLAGQFSIAITMMNMLLSFTSAWPMSQAAYYGTLIASGRFSEVRTHLPGMLGASTMLAVVMAAAMSTVLWVINNLGMEFAQRITDPGTTAIILAAAIAHHVVVCFAMPLRAERREPFLFVSVVGGIATAIAIWLAARYGTARDIALVNLVCAFIGIPIAYYLFRARSQVWMI